MTDINEIVRMTVKAQNTEARKRATSILRDWNRPNSWSTGLLRNSAREWLDNQPHGVLNYAEAKLMADIADGTAVRPEEK